MLSLMRERKKRKKRLIIDKYPWLDDSGERKYMTVREIFEKTYKFGQLVFDRIRKSTSKRHDLQV